jgi:hypothetical protein
MQKFKSKKQKSMGKKNEVRKFERKNIGALPTSGTDRRELEGR